jgi:hypothetical protein
MIVSAVHACGPVCMPAFVCGDWRGGIDCLGRRRRGGGCQEVLFSSPFPSPFYLLSFC